MTRGSPKSLAVPFDAVRRRGDRHGLRAIAGRADRPTHREVATGLAALRRAGIASGPRSGEVAVLSVR